MNLPSLATAFLAALTLASCASSRNSAWSPEWITKIGNVNLVPCRLSPKAYQKPVGTDTGTADYVGSRIYMASGGDNVVGLVTGMVSRGIARGQQNDFEEKNRDYFTGLEQFFTSGFAGDLGTQLSQALDRTSFRTRRTEPYGALLYADIQECGFSRAGVNAADEVLLTPAVKLNVVMHSTDKRKVYMVENLTFDAAAEGIKHTARELATDPALRRHAQEVLSTKIANAFTEVIKRKLGEQ